ncbi:MAG: decaprenyl-phosphate phosphoribosyltransferase [Anaerolineae bacterium]
MLRELLLSMRPKQWTKNLVIFAALVFDLKLGDLTFLSRAVAAFVIFSALSSAVYLINDLVDMDRDRAHPEKRNRPLAAGRLNPTWAGGAAGLLSLGALPAAFYVDQLLGLIGLGYLLIQIAYSLVLKNLVILDVITVALGFVLRVGAGAVVVEVERFSPWLYICMTLLALFLALSKRRHELVLLESGAGEHRKILREYSSGLLEEMIAVVTSATVIAYSLYTFSAENLPSNHAMMLTIPFVLYGVFRYLFIVHQRDLAGSPEEALVRDAPLVANNLLWGVAVVAILYLF